MNYITSHLIFSKKPNEILVFNYNFNDYIDVDMHYVSYIGRKKRKNMLGKWKIKMKNK